MDLLASFSPLEATFGLLESLLELGERRVCLQQPDPLMGWSLRLDRSQQGGQR